MQVFVTGIGCISPLGLTVAENEMHLRTGSDGLVHPRYLDSRYAPKKYFGEVPASNSELLGMLQADPEGLTRTDLLAWNAFKKATEHARLSQSDIASRSTAFISASTVGGMCITDQLYRDANLHSADTEFASSYNCAAHTMRIYSEYGMTGFADTINTACSSSANAVMLGARLIKSGRCMRAIVGGVDSLAKYTVNGFNALQILSDEKCRPFDENRSGLNLGEGAAYLVLESADVCNSKKRYAEVTGYGNANDAFHTSSMSDTADGAVSCMVSALAVAGLQPSAIDCINAHGTGTGNNDAVEVHAFKSVFGTIPSFSSTKSYTGHTLGAAGALEAIFAVLSLSNQELYPSLRIETPVGDSVDSIVQEYRKNEHTMHCMSNSYGFGGNCTSLIFSRV